MLTARMNRLFPELAPALGMFPPVFPPVERVVESLLSAPAEAAGVQPVFPALNVWEDEGAVHVEAELPGWTLDELEIGMTGPALTIAGKRREKPEDGAGRTLRLRERRSGQTSFERTLEFRTPIDADAVAATLKDGVLTVTLPKAAEAKPRKIEIRTA
jgi:HSP20 family protein